MPAPTIGSGLKQILAPHVPFAQMTDADLDFLVNHVEVAYFAPGEVVLAPDGEIAPHCLIVKQGRVRGLQTVRGKLDRDTPAFEAAVGDCFPVGALLAQRPVGLTYEAVGDTFCLLLPRARFEQLTLRSAAFLDFCKRRLGSLLDLSRQQLQATYAAEASVEHTMGAPLGELVRGAPVTCRSDDSLRVAFERMDARHVGSVLVTQDAPPGEAVVGILTRTDLISRIILPQVSLDAPISSVMTSGVRTLEADATAAEATLLMAEHSIRHVPIMRTRDGRREVAGVVSERDLFTLQRLSVRQLAEAIRRAPDAGSLAAVAADVRRLSHTLVAQGVAAAQLTRLISHLNDQLTTRLLTLACGQFEVTPESFCWLALGSEGRAEQTIATDQDNGLLFAEGKADAARMLALADTVNQALDQAGFPLCKGNIMARNPAWCLSLPQWKALFTDWIDRGDPDALLNGSIFFDFRGIFGDRGLGDQLRASVVAAAQRNPRFLKQMTDNALRNRLPGAGMLEGLFGQDLGDALDLKLHGTVPLVDAARIWALAAGLHETNTADRLRRLSDAGRLPAIDVAGWLDAFQFLQLMRLRVQHQAALRPEQGDRDNPNLIDPARLSALDRRILKESLRQARKAQQRLEMDFPG
jgi:CBS domain-containing protein